MYRPKFEPWTLGSEISLSPGKANPLFLRLADLYGALYLRIFTGLDAIKFRGVANLTDAYLAARSNKIRFLLAFRHPGDNDPQCLFLSLNTLLQKQFRKAGLPRRPGQVFLASAEIPLWGGPLIAWVLQSAGIVPVSHGQMDRSSMETILSAMTTSPLPVVLAPEGQVTYFSRAVPDLDDGTAQLCLWASQRLQAQGHNQSLEIIPVGIRYCFPTVTWKRLCRFIHDLKIFVGLDSNKKDLAHLTNSDQGLVELKKQFLTIWNSILNQAENHYSQAYSYQKPASNDPDQRSSALAEFALERVENYLGKRGAGDRRQRCMFLRTTIMHLAFAKDSKKVKQGYLTEKLAQRACANAYWMHRHLEFVDSAWYLRPEKLFAFSDLDGAIESAQNLQDYAARLIGGSFGSRRRFFRKTVEISFGESLKTADLLDQKRKLALGLIRQRLFKAYQSLIS